MSGSKPHKYCYFFFCRKFWFSAYSLVVLLALPRNPLRPQLIANPFTALSSPETTAASRCSKSARASTKHSEPTSSNCLRPTIHHLCRTKRAWGVKMWVTFVPLFVTQQMQVANSSTWMAADCPPSYPLSTPGQIAQVNLPISFGHRC